MAAGTAIGGIAEDSGTAKPTSPSNYSTIFYQYSLGVLFMIALRCVNLIVAAILLFEVK